MAAAIVGAMRSLLALMISMLAWPSTVRAEPAAEVAAAAPPAPSRHLVYAEVMGKGGLYGLGYELRLTDRLAAGLVGAAYPVGDRTVLTAAPYLHARLLGSERHAWFAQLGPQLIHQRVRSPVPEWPGERDTSLGAQVSSGWERRGPVTVRLSLSAMLGRGGIAPWAGAAVGWSF